MEDLIIQNAVIQCINGALIILLLWFALLLVYGCAYVINFYVQASPYAKAGTRPAMPLSKSLLSPNVK
jgi:hypothetical protein